MEIRQGQQTLVGFPALVDKHDAVAIEVFDEPDVAARHHRLGLLRLFAFQIKDALKYLEKNIPDFTGHVRRLHVAGYSRSATDTDYRSGRWTARFYRRRCRKMPPAFARAHWRGARASDINCQ